MSRKILLADDSLTIQKVVELTFMEGDYEVIAVSNGDDALMRLMEVSPDVVIADVHMPGADGLEICRRTKENNPTTPVLLLVGTFEPFDEGAAREVGAEAHLKKPFDSQELLRLIEDLLGVSAESSAQPATVEEEADFPRDNEDSYGAADADLAEESSTMVEPSGDGVPTSDFDLSPENRTPMVDTGDAAFARLSDEDVERIARRVVELIGEETVREISWDVIPDLAEILIKDRIRELENQVD